MYGLKYVYVLSLSRTGFSDRWLYELLTVALLLRDLPSSSSFDPQHLIGIIFVHIVIVSLCSLRVHFIGPFHRVEPLICG